MHTVVEPPMLMIYAMFQPERQNLLLQVVIKKLQQFMKFQPFYGFGIHAVGSEFEFFKLNALRSSCAPIHPTSECSSKRLVPISLIAASGTF